MAVRSPAAPPAALSTDRGGLRLLVVSATVVLVTVVAWLVSMVATGPTGDVGEQLAALGEGMGVYRWGFVNAALINPAFVVMLAAAAVLLVRSPWRPHEAAGGLVLAVYWLLPTLAYISQFALLPRLLASDAPAEAWFFGNPASLPYWLAMTGYGLFGVGALLLASRFVTGGVGGFGWLLVGSGATSLLGLVGYSVASDVLEFASVIGGALVVPLAVLALLAARRHVGQT